MTEHNMERPAAPRRSWLPFALLVAAGLLVYSNSLRSPLALDDLNAIIRNPGIRRLWPLHEALTPPPGPISFYTRPVLNLTMAYDYARSGENVTGYRRTNLMLHVLSGVMLYLLLGLLMKRGASGRGAAGRALPPWVRDCFTDGGQLAAFLAALIWIVHPLNTAAVNYLSQRGELLVALFLFVMLYSLAKAAAAGPDARRLLWGGLAVGACLLGMGSKEHMLAAPALALLFDRCFLSDSWRGLLRRRGVLHLLFWLTALWPLHRQALHSPHLTPDLMTEGVRWHYLWTQCWGLTRMIRLAFWPRPLVFFYGMDLIRSPWAVWPQALFLLSLMGLTVWALFRRPRIGFAGAVFFGMLAPSSTLVPILGQPIAEHRMVVPLAAIAALVAWAGVAWAARSRRPGAWPFFAAAGLAVAILFGAEAHRRNTVYRDPLTLWEDTVQKVPASAEPRNNYANALRGTGRLADAEEQYRRAVHLRPDFTDAQINLGTLLAQTGRFEEALLRLEEALSSQPDNLQLQYRLGSLHVRLGRFEEALPYLEAVHRARLADARVVAELAHVLAELGRGDEALQRIRAALAARPDDPELNNTLGVLCCHLGRPAEAVEPLRTALAAAPGRSRIRFNLGRALFDAGQVEEAKEVFRQIGPGDPAAADARAYLEKIADRREEESAP